MHTFLSALALMCCLYSTTVSAKEHKPSTKTSRALNRLLPGIVAGGVAALGAVTLLIISRQNNSSGLTSSDPQATVVVYDHQDRKRVYCFDSAIRIPEEDTYSQRNALEIDFTGQPCHPRTVPLNISRWSRDGTWCIAHSYTLVHAFQQANDVFLVTIDANQRIHLRHQILSDTIIDSSPLVQEKQVKHSKEKTASSVLRKLMALKPSGPELQKEFNRLCEKGKTPRIFEQSKINPTECAQLVATLVANSKKTTPPQARQIIQDVVVPNQALLTTIITSKMFAPRFVNNTVEALHKLISSAGNGSALSLELQYLLREKCEKRAADGELQEESKTYISVMAALQRKPRELAA